MFKISSLNSRAVNHFYFLPLYISFNISKISMYYSCNKKREKKNSLCMCMYVREKWKEKGKNSKEHHADR